ncbi:N-acetyltransferase GCN5 [Aureimonas endophytica]|uniref:N-acetyltransferase GCN5 n=1 Tax=Aureimonas endophytica TaxID=2027858 RepID=A0A917E7M0_9HYPH|nr:GNAT family N-acetyltransferase [Aureimonas endophytica]GGE08519.1 N-acetyltransferase GCN5 [Aureimonas endophytica]
MKTVAADIRFAEDRDAAALAAIHADAWQGAYAGIIPYPALRAMIRRRDPSWWREAVRRRAAILLLEFDGAPVGYATLGRNRMPALAVGGEIYEIYLLPAFQGVGLGRRLFGAARGLLAERGLAGTTVWALAENRNAVAFYRGLGGVNVAEGRESFGSVAVKKLAFLWR